MEPSESDNEVASAWEDTQVEYIETWKICKGFFIALSNGTKVSLTRSGIFLYFVNTVKPHYLEHLLPLIPHLLRQLLGNCPYMLHYI